MFLFLGGVSAAAVTSRSENDLYLHLETSSRSRGDTMSNSEEKKKAVQKHDKEVQTISSSMAESKKQTGPSIFPKNKTSEFSNLREIMDEEEKDRLKRASRNRSEKKRRDQFNVLIQELCTMLQGQDQPIKMDKATILQKTIDFLQKQKEKERQAQVAAARGNWKSSFLSNEEFTQLMFEALDEFMIALTTEGIIIYVSDNVSSLLGHIPSELVCQNILTLLPEQEHSEILKILSPQTILPAPVSADFLNEKQIEFSCHLARGRVNPTDPMIYEFVKFFVDFKYLSHVPIPACRDFESVVARTFKSAKDDPLCLVATVRLNSPQILKEICTLEETGAEFASRHSMEWKFLFLDHRAPPIIGYLPFEVMGTSGYDYYHADDLEPLARCHENLMRCGKGKSCYYRFLTKGQQWIWLQTEYYITYHQWNSKPEFIVCTHTVVSYTQIQTERSKELAFGATAGKMPIMPVSFKNSSSFASTPQHGNNLEGRRDQASGSSRSYCRSSLTLLSSSASKLSPQSSKSASKTPLRWELPVEQPDNNFSKTFSTEVASSSSSSTRPRTCTQSQSIPQTFAEKLVAHHAASGKLPIISSQPEAVSMFQSSGKPGGMQPFKKVPEKQTQALQANVETPKQAFHTIEGCLQSVQDPNFQVLDPKPIDSFSAKTSGLHSLRRESLSLTPPILSPSSLNAKRPKASKCKKNQRRNRTPKTKSRSDGLGTQPFRCSNCPSVQFLQETCIPSCQQPQIQTQMPVQSQLHPQPLPQLQLQPQPQPQSQLQPQPQPQHMLNDNELQEIYLPEDTRLSVPLYGDPMLFSETYSITVSAELPFDIIQQPIDYEDFTLGFLQDDRLLPAPSAFTPTMLIPTTDLAILDPQQLPVHSWQPPTVPQSDVCVQIHAPEAVQGNQTPGLFQAPQLLPSPSMGYFLHTSQSNQEPSEI